jgi:hypothetical protein
MRLGMGRFGRLVVGWFAETIIHGRRIHSHAVLSRIADGLGIPGGYLGLTCCPCPHTTQHVLTSSVAESP